MFQNYLWTGGSTEQNLIVDTTGNYLVIVTDSMGCQNSDEVFVLVNPTPLAEFSYSGEALEIYFLNNSKNANTYFWDFGDGQYSDEKKPVYTYQAPGEYKVILTASNTKCGNSQFSQLITIVGTSVELFNVDDLVLIYPNPSNGIFIIENRGAITLNVKVEIINLVGQIIYSKHYKTANVI